MRRYTGDMEQRAKTVRQVRFLLSDGSPLTEEQKQRLREELRRGQIRLLAKRAKQVRR